jgi:hypothetical protein
MITKIDIASMALGLLEASPISSFDSGTNEADIVKSFYPSFLKKIFSKHPWKFSRKKARLNMSADYVPLNEYRNAFIVPAECERVVAIYDSKVVGARPCADYKLMDGYVLFNHAAAWMEYVYVKDEQFWPGWFIDFAVYALAALIARPVTGKDAIEAAMQAMAYGSPSQTERGGKFAVAATNDAQEAPPEELPADELSISRF